MANHIYQKPPPLFTMSNYCYQDMQTFTKVNVTQIALQSSDPEPTYKVYIVWKQRKQGVYELSINLDLQSALHGLKIEKTKSV